MTTPEDIRAQILALVKEYHTAKFAHKTFDPDKDLVHYAGRVFDAEEVVNLVDASLDFYLTANRYAERFEAEFAEYLGLSNALLVNSGSSANLVALTALTSPKLKDRRLKYGDEVITTACGFPTTLNPILQNQLVPVFVDVNLGDYTAIPERLADAIGLKTKAVMMAHTMGVPFHLDAVIDLVNKHNLWLIEDNCDALGSTYTPSPQISRLAINGEVIEEYVDRKRVLIYAELKEENLPVHIIVDYSFREEPVIVTAYVPDSRYWLKYKTRKARK